MENCPDLNGNLAAQAAHLVSMAIRGSAYPPEVVKPYLEAVGAAERHVLRDYVTEEFRSRGANRLSRGKVSQRVVIKTALDEKEQIELADLFSEEIEVKFSPTGINTHGKANAVRTIMRALLLNAMSGAPSIIDFGGNYVPHLWEGRANVHCCCPKLDFRDLARAPTREELIMASGKSPRLAQLVAEYEADPEKFVCTGTALECSAYAMYGMCLDVYDIPMEDWADIMDRHGMSYMYGFMMMPEDRIFRTKGTIPAMNVEYDHDPVTGKIVFAFRDCPAMSYRHSLKDLLMYTKNHVLVSSKGNQYYYEVVDSRKIGITYRIMRAEVPFDLTTLGEAAIFARRDTVVKLKTYTVNPLARRDNELVPIEVECPSQMFELVVSRAITLTGEKFQKTEIVRLLRAYASSFVVNGVSLCEGEHVEHAKLGAIAAVVYLVAYRKRSTMASLHSMFAEYQDKLRNFGKAGLWYKTGEVMKKWWYAQMRPIQDGIDAVAESMFGGLSLSIADVDVMLMDMLVDVKPGVLGLENMLPNALAEPFLGNTDDLLDSLCLESDLDWAAEMDAVDERDDVSKGKGKSDVSEPSSMASSVDSLPSKTLAGDTAVQTVNDDVLCGDEFVDKDYLKKLDDAYVGQSVGREQVPLENAFTEERRAVDHMIDTSFSSVETNPPEFIPNPLVALKEYITYLEVEENTKMERAMNWLLLTWNSSNNPTYDQRQLLLGQTAEGNPMYVGTQRCVVNGTPHSMIAFSLLGKKVNSTDYMVGLNPLSKLLVRSKNLYDRAGNVTHTLWPANVQYLFVMDDFRVWNYPVMIPSLRKLLLDAERDYDMYKMPKVTAIFGVPGCGKSRKATVDFKRSELVLCYSRSATKGLRRHLSDLTTGKLTVEESQRQVKTIDSFLMHSTKGTNLVHVDEGLMCHYGALVAIALKTKCKEMVVYGDPVQIRFINRVKTFGCYHAHDILPTSVCLMGVSDRVPPSAAAGLKRYYNGNIYSSREDAVNNLPSVREFSHLGELKRDCANVQYLVMYKEDKAILLAEGFHNVLTVGEAQGDTYKNVALLRLDKAKGPLFYSDPHVVVACSRHMYDFVYYSKTPDDDDVRRFVRDARNMLKVREAIYNPEKHGPRERKMPFSKEMLRLDTLK